MNRRFKGLQLGLLMSGLVTAVAIGCGGDDENDGPGATGKGGSGGASGGNSGKGGKGSGKGGNGTAGDDGVAGDNTGVAGEGAGGQPPVIVPGEIDDVISAICDWELRCCDDGERVYRLGPDGADAMSCVDFFTFQLHMSNQTNNPFPAGSATGLLGTLGYTVNLDRVTPDALGIGACVAFWEAADCNMDAEPPTSCSGTIIPGEGVCSLTNLFDPALVEGDECTVELDEGDGNDIECEAGTTCLPAAHADNPESVDICVQRGVAGEPCTEDEDCDWNFYCDPANDCQPKGAIGDPCTFNDAVPAPNDEDAGCQAGLKCHPDDLVCVENCATGYPCVADIECPDGESCAPLTVGNDTTSWKACRGLGTTVVSCDNSADCAESRRCSGGDCLADVVIGMPCTADSDCEEGSFCDTSTRNPDASAGRIPTMQCTAYFGPSDPCFPLHVTLMHNSGCDPATAGECTFSGTVVPAALAWTCSTTKLAAGDECFPLATILPGEPTDCAQGLDCEFANQAATTFTCAAGAGLGDQCDATVANGVYQLCGTGLFCDPITAECLAKQDPGGDCEDANGLAEPGLCKNGVCLPHWSGDGSFICSDAPVPESEDGDNLTCGP